LRYNSFPSIFTVPVNTFTVLTTTQENPFQTRSYSNGKGSTVRRNPGSPNSIYITTEFAEEKTKGMKFNEHRKSRNQRYKNYVSTIVVTTVGTSVSLSLIVAIVHQIRSIMSRKSHVNTSDPEQSGTYDEIRI
jgi:hypothetical protein